MMRKNQKQTRLCPLLDRECENQACMIYNEKFDRCEIGLLAYNLYALSAALRQNPEKPFLK